MSGKNCAGIVEFGSSRRELLSWIVAEPSGTRRICIPPSSTKKVLTHDFLGIAQTTLEEDEEDDDDE